MSRLTRDGTAEPVWPDLFRRERAQGNVNFPCSADHEQDWQPYLVDPYACYMCDHTYTFQCSSKYIPLESWRTHSRTNKFLNTEFGHCIATFYDRWYKAVLEVGLSACVQVRLKACIVYVHKPDVQNKWEINVSATV